MIMKSLWIAAGIVAAMAVVLALHIGMTPALHNRSKIAYSLESFDGIASVDTDGSNQRVVIDDGITLSCPRWSPPIY
jgi:hypothetical protein